MNETFTFKINKNKNTNTNTQTTFDFYKNDQTIGFIDYYDEYTQIVISMVYINQDNIDANIQYRRKGYGSLMISNFINYVKQKYDMVNKIVLIPSKFDGVNKNWLCNFYEKNGFVQERNGFPFYIKKI